MLIDRWPWWVRTERKEERHQPEETRECQERREAEVWEVEMERVSELEERARLGRSTEEGEAVREGTGTGTGTGARRGERKSVSSSGASTRANEPMTDKDPMLRLVTAGGLAAPRASREGSCPCSGDDEAWQVHVQEWYTRGRPWGGGMLDVLDRDVGDAGKSEGGSKAGRSSSSSASDKDGLEEISSSIGGGA